MMWLAIALLAIGELAIGYWLILVNRATGKLWALILADQTASQPPQRECGASIYTGKDMYFVGLCAEPYGSEHSHEDPVVHVRVYGDTG